MKSNLLEINVSRTEERGLEISLKSDANFLFNSWFDRRDYDNTIGGVLCARARNDYLEEFGGKFYRDNMFEDGDGNPNLTLLLARDIKNGVVFKFGHFPISDKQILNWANKFKAQTKALYLTYMKEVKLSVVITTETVEREPHN